jgi:plastocyanin
VTVETRRGAAQTQTTGRCRLTFAIGLSVLVGLAGCGGSSATSSSSSTAGQAATVTLKYIAFNPATVTISAGQSVGWVWDDNQVAHNVDFGSFRSQLQTSGRFQHTFTSPGTYHYRCDIHPNMTGTVEVTQ